MRTKQAASLANLAYAKVKQQIIFHEIKAGQTVDELSLARQLDLTRTPVREAVQRLAQEGLLRIIPRKGTIVAELSLDMVRQVFEARTPCEAQIVRLAALRAEAADIEMMESSLADVDRLIDQRRFRELLEADERFHMCVAAAAKNQLLREMFVKVYGLGVRFWYLTLPQRPGEEIKEEMRLHREVVEAIKKRDPDLAAEAILTLVASFPDRVAHVLRQAIPIST
jgi:DNA-binding GntR family transcriptional regulator